MTTATFAMADGRERAAASSQASPSFGFESELKILTDPASAEAEAFRSLRGHLISQHFSQGRRGLAVCAPDEEAGTAFVSASLAIALAEVGLNTVLIEGNLLKPRLAKLILPPSEPVGLVERLRSGAPFDSFVDGRPLPNLSVMYAGPVDKKSQEVLAAPRFRELVGFCLRNFDATIIDSAPANVSHGAVQVSVVVGYSVLVVRKDQTFYRDLKTLAGELTSDGVKIVGNILCGA